WWLGAGAGPRGISSWGTRKPTLQEDSSVRTKPRWRVGLSRVQVSRSGCLRQLRGERPDLVESDAMEVVITDHPDRKFRVAQALDESQGVGVLGDVDVAVRDALAAAILH